MWSLLQFIYCSLLRLEIHLKTLHCHDFSSSSFVYLCSTSSKDMFVLFSTLLQQTWQQFNPNENTQQNLKYPIFISQTCQPPCTIQVRYIIVIFPTITVYLLRVVVAKYINFWWDLILLLWYMVSIPLNIYGFHTPQISNVYVSLYSSLYT